MYCFGAAREKMLIFEFFFACNEKFVYLQLLLITLDMRQRIVIQLSVGK